MPKIDFSKRNFFMGPETSRIYYRVNGINLHNGVVGYNSNTRELIVHDEDEALWHKENVEKRMDAVDVLSAPRLNGCHFILIKSKQNPHLFAMAHIAPLDDKRQMYRELLQKFPPGDELNVVFCAGYSGDINSLAQISEEKGYNLSSVRTIPFNFDVETFVIRGEPKSVYFHFIPSDDELIIYSDSYSTTGKPAIHIGTNVFNDAPKPIEFHKLEIFASQALTKKALSSPHEFVTILPALTEKFLSDHPKSRLYSYETCPDHIAESQKEKKLMAIKLGFDFEAKDRSQNLKIEDNAEIKEKLSTYRERIEKNKNAKEETDYAHGFWVLKKSRAISRKINYLLAIKLLDHLSKNSGDFSIYEEVMKLRQGIVDELTPEDKKHYAERGINSTELNEIIKAFKPKK